MGAICLLRVRREDGVNADWLVRFFDTFGLKLAAWAGLLMVSVHWFKARSERMRDQVEEKGTDWSRLRGEIDRLDKRCDDLQQDVDDCRKREGEWMMRALAAEGRELVAGEARQAAQRIVSAERAEKPK